MLDFPSHPISLLSKSKSTVLAGQPVQRGDRHFQMLFPGILNLVVADATQGFEQTSYRWNPRARDLGRVVKGAGGKPLRFAGKLPNGLLAELDHVRMKRDRLDAPDP